MTELQQNQEYIISMLYDKRYITQYSIDNVIKETFEQLEKKEIEWRHAQNDLILQKIKNNPDLKDVAIFLLSFTDTDRA